MLIVTEGVKTEVQYFEGLVQYLRSSGTAVRGVRPKGIGKDPLRVLQAAIEFNDRDPDGYDQIWVVVDVDEHTTLEAALAQGEALKVPVVVSNPCFEIWLIWHYVDSPAHRTSRAAARWLEQHKHTDKQIPNTFPYHEYGQAIRRAGNEVDLWEIGPNPSSALPHLLSELRR